MERFLFFLMKHFNQLFGVGFKIFAKLNPKLCKPQNQFIDSCNDKVTNLSVGGGQTT